MATTKYSFMTAKVSNEAYNYVKEMARLFSNNRVDSLYYEYLMNEGLEGLQKAINTYEGEGKGAQFVTYMHRVVKNHLINEKKRFLLHKLDIKDPKTNEEDKRDNLSDDSASASRMCEGYDMLNDEDTNEVDSMGGTSTRIKDETEVKLFKSMLLRANKGNERNAHIVELVIGFQCEPMELKEIAKLYALSHESVRLVYTKTIKTLREDKGAKRFLLSLVG